MATTAGRCRTVVLAGSAKSSSERPPVVVTWSVATKMAVGRIRVGYRQVSGFAVLNLGMISHLKFLGWAPELTGFDFEFDFLFVDIQ